MLRKLLSIAALCLALSAGVQREALATSLVPLTIEQMTDASDLVIRGMVTEVWAFEDDKGRIWTRAQIEVTKVLKGDPATQTVIVDQLGGVWNDSMMLVSDAARFSVGEDAYFFLENLKSGHTVTVGMYQGKFTVQQAPHTGDQRVVRYTIPQDRPYDHRFLPNDRPGEPVATLEDRVSDRVELGWDGQPIPGADSAKLHRINKLQPGVQ